MTQSSSRRRKVLALLAAGAVVGVGGAYTLAAWNDSEFALAGFGSGHFNLEGSLSATDGFAEHSTTGAAAQLDNVNFDADTSNMVPGETSYDSFYVRLDAATTVDGSLAQGAITGGGATEQYGYTVRAIGATDVCDATAAGTVVGQGDNLTTNTATGSVDLAQGAGSGVAGAVVQLCIAVTASDELAQDAAATVNWEFVATSADPA